MLASLRRPVHGDPRHHRRESARLRSRPISASPPATPMAAHGLHSRSAVCCCSGGRAADLLGRRTVFLAGLQVFSGASLGRAGAVGGRIAGRPRGPGTGGGHAVAGRAVARHDDLRRGPGAPARPGPPGQRSRVRRRAFGALAGGLLTETLGWRAIFLINRRSGSPPPWRRSACSGAGAHRARRLDAGGALIATASSWHAYGLVQAPEAGWAIAADTRPPGGAAAGLASFVLVESRVREPLVRLRCSGAGPRPPRSC